MKKILFFFLLWGPLLIAQNQVDSLKQAIDSSNSKQEQIELLIDLGNSLTDKDARIEAYLRILPLANTEELKFYKGSAHLGAGIVYHQIQQKDSAEYHYKTAIPFLIDKNRYLDLGSIYNNLALLNKDYLDTSIYYAEQSLFYRYKSGDSLQVAHGHMLVGDIADEAGQYSKSMNHYLKSVKIYDATQFIPGQINVYNNIGILYGRLGQFDKKIDYCKKTIDKIIYSKDSTHLAGALNNLAFAYMEAGEYKKSIETHRKAIRLKQKKGPYAKGESFKGLAETYYKMGETDSALYYGKKAHQLFLETNSPYVLFYTHNLLGLIYLEQHQISKAEEHLQKAEEYGELSGALPDLKVLYESLSKLYEDKKSYKEALHYYQKYTTVKDSIFSKESEQMVQELSAEYESELKELEINNLEKESKLKDVKLAQEQKNVKSKNRQLTIIIVALAISILLALLAIKGFLDKKKANNIVSEQKQAVEQQKNLIELAHANLEEKNEEIMDSIKYAKRIQSAILPSKKRLAQYLSNSFVLYKPKDIVAGDFYWLEEKNDTLFIAAADCTGHGVPGAMVSVICNNGLNRSVREHGITDPGKILDKTREIVLQEFEKSEEEVKDGMDIALISLRAEEQDHSFVVEFAGAHNPLWIIRKGATEVEVIKANKQPVGKFRQSTPFTTHQVKLHKEDCIYLFSDGFADQFGGEKGKKFKAANFKKLLLSIQDKPIKKQGELLDQAFEKWKGELEQLDDVCVIGVKI